MKTQVYSDDDINKAIREQITTPFSRPQNHFKAFFKLASICEFLKSDCFVCFPLRTSFIPTYMTIDSKIVNFHILKNKKVSSDKLDIWNQVVYLQKKALRRQGTISFEGTIQTDGVGVSVIKQNFPTSRKQVGNKRRKDIDTDENKVEYIEKLTSSQHAEIKGKCVLMDPNRRGLLYCMKETSSTERKQILRYTQSSRSKLSRHFRKLQKNLKPEDVRFAEEMTIRAEYEDVLTEYYGNETKTNVRNFYPDTINDFFITKTHDLYWGRLFVARFTGTFPKNNTDNEDELFKLQNFITHLQILLNQAHVKKRLPKTTITHISRFAEEALIWSFGCQDQAAIIQKLKVVKNFTSSQLQTLNLLPFRKMRFSGKLYSRQNEESLVKGLKEKFGRINKGLISMLQKNDLKVLLIDEFKTSSVCPDCEGKLEKFKRVTNPRPHKRQKHPTVICNGLLRCSNHQPVKLWNRDQAAVCNFKKILVELRKSEKRPDCLARSNATTSFKRRREDSSSSDYKKAKILST
ncbi:hypothetical protein BCV71DRAFT_264518 [Rhizopus microsporus]|uniref:Uncharacterized protein n=1 Tax=Rhizopus microsporus TaxID=58291 RepID=A0A1X0S0P7_RHIZD|nr:hypothetical protein BCV71DRAFT_264518 [Rhizopus microsporus]